MGNKEEIQMLDDDSKAFKLLYNELKDDKKITVKDVGQAAVGDIKDKPDYLLQLFTKVGNDKKTYLHYTNEDLTKDGENLRNQIQKVERVGFKNQIVLPFEGMDNQTVEQRYAELRRAGVFSEKVKEDKKAVAQIEKKEEVREFKSEVQAKSEVKSNKYDNEPKKKKKWYR